VDGKLGTFKEGLFGPQIAAQDTNLVSAIANPRDLFTIYLTISIERKFLLSRQFGVFKEREGVESHWTQMGSTLEGGFVTCSSGMSPGRFAIPNSLHMCKWLLESRY
jgi:hypothetical protein